MAVINNILFAHSASAGDCDRDQAYLPGTGDNMMT